MDMLEWLSNQEHRFREKNKEAWMRLLDCFKQACLSRESDPDFAFASCTACKQIAQEFGDPWLVLFLESMRIELLLHFKRDYRNVLDMVVQCVADLRKPACVAYPGRLDIWDELIAAYLGIDAEGYEEEIREAMDCLDKEMPEGPNANRYLLLTRRRIFAMECDRLTDAYDACMQELQLSASDKDQSQATTMAEYTYCTLCTIAALAKDWETLACWSSKAAEFCRINGVHCELAEALAWQAVAALQQGDQEAAQQAHRSAVLEMSRLKLPPTRGYYDALASYHLYRRDRSAALAVRDGELKTIAGWGRLLYECRVHIQRARLLSQLGRLQEPDLLAARDIPRKLRKPEQYLNAIDEIAAGLEAQKAED
jgi:hypothetical protein